MNKHFYTAAFIAVLGTHFSISPAHACDVCALGLGDRSGSLTAHETQIRLDEQLLVLKDLELGDRRIDNSAKERMTTSISHLVFAYGLTSKVKFEATLPILSRHYRRLNGETTRSASDSGIGDVTLKAEAIVFDTGACEASTRLSLFGGIKIPTGDSRRLLSDHHDELLETDSNTEMTEEHHDEEGHMHGLSRHSEDTGHDDMLPSAIHEHDLAFGSGSFDFPVGFRLQQLFGKWGLGIDSQYLIKTSGRADYRFGNDWVYSGWAGRQLSLENGNSLWLAAHLTGERKDSDRRSGAEEDATQFATMYVGPSLSFASPVVDASFALDIPVKTETEGLQLVPETRVRFSLGYRF